MNAPLASDAKVLPIDVTPGVAEKDDEITLAEIFHQLWFRRRMLFSTALLITAVGVVILFQLVPRYTATSSLMIGVAKSQVVDIEAVLAGMAAGGNWTIQGEIEVLRSRELAKTVVSTLNLQSLPEFNSSLQPRGITSYLNPLQYIPAEWKLVFGRSPPPKRSDEELEQARIASAASRLLGMLIVEQVGQSNVVQIRVESTNPQLAAQIANELPELYIIGQLEAKFDATEKATVWLNEQLNELKGKVEASESAVEIYRQQTGVTDVKGSGVVLEQLLAINGELIVARTERAQAEARLNQIQQLMRGGGAGVESASEVLASGLIQRLREKELEVNRKTSELSTEYGPKHPKILQVNAELNDIRKGIRLEIEKIAAGIKNDVSVARSRERSLQQSLDELEETHGMHRRESVQLRALEREAEANRALFETFLGRFKETSSSGGIEEPDARVISKAEVPGGPSFPNKRLYFMMIVAVAVAAAMLLVFVVQLVTPGLQSPEQVEQELKIPVIGLVPRVVGDEPAEYLLKKPQSSYAEALNTLKTAMFLSDPDKVVKTIMITSSVPEEGKSTLALSYARVLARAGKKVVLIDADLRRASLEKKLGLKPLATGFTDMLVAEEKQLRFQDFGIIDEFSGALIIPKGGAEFVNASDILSSHRLESVMATMKEQFDYVIFDTPPVMVVSDARLLGRLVDKNLFVVRWDKTPKKVIKSALHQINHSEIDIAGIVLQQVDLQRSGSHGFGDTGYYYHYGKYGQYYNG